MCFVIQPKRKHNQQYEGENINNSIKELGGLDADREKNIQLIQFQIDEINNANLKENEEDDLKSQIKIMENAEKI